MKMHRIVVYVKDINGSAPTAASAMQQIYANKWPEFLSFGPYQTVDVGEWDDDHPLNKKGTDHEGFFK